MICKLVAQLFKKEMLTSLLLHPYQETIDYSKQTLFVNNAYLVLEYLMFIYKKKLKGTGQTLLNISSKTLHYSFYLSLHCRSPRSLLEERIIRISFKFDFK
jgi:hypothetical protein